MRRMQGCHPRTVVSERFGECPYISCPIVFIATNGLQPFTEHINDKWEMGMFLLAEW